MGAIGKRLAERLLYFGVNTIYSDPVRIPDEEEENLGVSYAPMDELLHRSDIVSLHVPLTKETDRFIGEKEFNLMKDAAIFINTSRGEGESFEMCILFFASVILLIISLTFCRDEW